MNYATHYLYKVLRTNLVVPYDSKEVMHATCIVSSNSESHIRIQYWNTKYDFLAYVWSLVRYHDIIPSVDQ